MPVTASGYRQFREEMKAAWKAVDAPCGICGQKGIDWDGPPFQPESFELDHRKPRKRFPELTLVASNAVPSHHRCNRSKSSKEDAGGIGTTSEDW